MLLTPLPLLLYIHGGKLREHVRQRKEAVAAADVAAKAAKGTATPKESSNETAIGGRIPPGGTVERQGSHSSADDSSALPDSAA